MEQPADPTSQKAQPLTRSRLGRGIGALLGNPPSESSTTEKSVHSESAHSESSQSLVELPIETITVNPFQPRREFDQNALQELATSIASNGIIQPVVVIRAGHAYQLIAGERRLRAAKLAKLTSIPAIVRQADPATQARLALIENIHRADLNPIERAESYQALIASTACTQAELAERLGEQRSTIANHLRLLDLLPAVRDQIRAGLLSLGHAKVLAGVDAAQQESLAKQAIDGNLSVRQLEQAIQTSAKSSPPPTASAHLADVAKQLSHALGMRVQLQRGPKKGTGRVVLHYTSLDEFDALLKKLDVRLDAD